MISKNDELCTDFSKAPPRGLANLNKGKKRQPAKKYLRLINISVML
jgi:hypothetical protein